LEKAPRFVNSDIARLHTIPRYVVIKVYRPSLETTHCCRAGLLDIAKATVEENGIGQSLRYHNEGSTSRHITKVQKAGTSDYRSLEVVISTAGSRVHDCGM